MIVNNAKFEVEVEFSNGVEMKLSAPMDEIYRIVQSAIVGSKVYRATVSDANTGEIYFDVINDDLITDETFDPEWDYEWD